MEILITVYCIAFLFKSQFANALNYSGLSIPRPPNSVNCTRDELTASGVQIASGKAWKEHGYTSRSLPELFNNLPPSVFEDILVRIYYYYYYYYYVFIYYLLCMIL